MARFINTYALETQRISSAALGPLGMVAHQMWTAGRFLGRIIEAQIEVARFELDVLQGGDPQADIDLAKLVVRSGSSEIRTRRYKVALEGFAVFFVSEGRGGYRVTLETMGEGKTKSKPKRVFDSAKLGANDMFAVTLIRPGIWTAHDRPSKGEASIQVTYPNLGKSAYRPTDEATIIKVGDQGMRPKKAKIGPGEGIVLLVETKAASITVELTKPDDGPPPKKSEPKPKGKRRVRWTNPRRPQD
jgi:hypothetical protein